jgi:hypothetical protein
MNDLPFIIWKMTQGWDEEENIALMAFPESSLLSHPAKVAHLWKSTGKSEAGLQIRELLTAAGYRHHEN